MDFPEDTNKKGAPSEFDPSFESFYFYSDILIPSTLRDE